MPRQTLTKREDGRYKCKYGSKQFYGRTQAEALKKRDAWILAEQAGLNHQADGISFREYSLNWVRVYRADAGAPQQKQYMNMMEAFADHLPKKAMKDITATDIQSFCNLLTTYSNSYISKFMTTLRGVFKSAFADGILLRNPLDNVIRPKGKKTEGHRPLEIWERNLVAATCQEHPFGLAAMTMMLAGLRRGEVLALNIDRDVDFENHTITVREALSFREGNQAVVTDGKTENARRVIPMAQPLEDALKGHHGLLCAKEKGGLMSESAFERKFQSWTTFLETKLNGCHKRWYGKTREHKALLEAGGQLPPWKEITIRCHDFRVDFCTRAYFAGIPIKTLQTWMGHADATLIMQVYAKLTQEQEETDAEKLRNYLTQTISLPAISLPETPEAGPVSASA